MTPRNFAFTLAVIFAPTAALADEITLIDPATLDWETTPQGVAFAALEGDRFTETYRAMVRLPAGTISPPHMKSANMYGVMIQGEMIHYANGEDPETAPKVGPGGFYKIPHGLPHVSACVSTNPCIAYVYQEASFDFVPVKP